MVGRSSSLPFPETLKKLKSIRSHPDPQCKDPCLIDSLGESIFKFKQQRLCGYRQRFTGFSSHFKQEPHQGDAILYWGLTLGEGICFSQFPVSSETWDDRTLRVVMNVKCDHICKLPIISGARKPSLPFFLLCSLSCEAIRNSCWKEGLEIPSEVFSLVLFWGKLCSQCRWCLVVLTVTFCLGVTAVQR